MMMMMMMMIKLVFFFPLSGSFIQLFDSSFHLLRVCVCV